MRTWMLSFFCLAQNIIRDGTKEKIEENDLEFIHSAFTPKGINSFKKYFGNDYYNKIGNTFELNIDNYMSF